MNNNLRPFLYALLFSFFLVTAPCGADEVVIDQAPAELGDYQCSRYRSGSNAILSLPNWKKSQISTGELWKFFDEQGVKSLETLVICFDVKQLDSDQSLEMNSLEMLIKESDSGKTLHQFSLGDNSLVFPASATNSDLPECRFEVDLGYNFMTEYSAESSEIVQLNLGVDGQTGSASPLLFIEGKRAWFTWPNLLMLFGFCSFWGGAFFLLLRFTTSDLSASSRKPKSQRLVVPGMRVASDSAA